MKQTPTATLRPLIILALLGALLIAPEAASPARACASQHLTAWLDGFEGGSGLPHFYLTAENDTPAPFRIELEIDGCSASGPTPAYVSWETTDVTATAGADYQNNTSSSDNLNVPVCGAEEHCFRSRTVNVTINDDNEGESVSETVRVRISTLDGRVNPPSSVPLYIVDDDGASRIGFAEPLNTMPYAQQEHFTSARIPVLRAGDDSAEVTVSYSLAGSGDDPAGPDDFGPATGTITFEPGDRLEFLEFTITNDKQVEANETITATLTGTGVGSPDTATFTIIDEDSDDQPPVTRFHHPRQGLKYKYNDYRIREMHTFFSDSGGSGVVRAWIALQQKRMDGRCAWHNGERFRLGRCAKKKWLPMRLIRAGDLYFFRPGVLRPSMGSEIKNYRAWTRAQDGAGNLETRFKVGRNLSTFEVKRR